MRNALRKADKITLNLKSKTQMKKLSLIQVSGLLLVLLFSFGAVEGATGFKADPAETAVVTLGSTDRETGYKFQLELTSKGGAIERALFSEFDNRDKENPQPLVILSPVYQRDGSSVLSMANTDFIFVEQKLQLGLDKLNWKSFGAERGSDGSQSARFEATIKTSDDTPIIKVVKSYKIFPDSYDIDFSLTVENLTSNEQSVRYNLSGPVGLDKEGVRADMRKAVAGFRNIKGDVTSDKLDSKKLRKAVTVEDRRLAKNSDRFLWGASTNKYFAAIVVPLPDEGKNFCDWVSDKTGRYYNPDGDAQGDSGDEAVGINFKITTAILAAHQSRRYNYRIYLGPKDKRIFSKNETYRNLGFVHTVDSMACCCPGAIIQPLSFGIQTAMEWMYGYLGNYGIVIIILVFIIRICIHPLTKHSQVSMHKMQKLAPKVEEIKKKYANNKAELNKRVMALYKEQGASPITSFLPMLVQMPIWIALYTTIYSSISLRGAPFLPFWITDLSVPDALFNFNAITLPLFGKLDSFNLLPLMMGVAFFLQQKLMPKPKSASASPQMEQQQKMMMFMMPIMFPLMLYKAPSGLNLYIMASTFAGVMEQFIIRKHIREKEEAQGQGLVAATSKTGGKFKKKKPKPFFKNM